jgi:hypothetical protein
MPQYYYNLSDGQLALDNEGFHAVNIGAARQEAMITAGQMLAEHRPTFDGAIWEMWVTDKPAGAGNTLFRLVFRATQGDTR